MQHLDELACKHGTDKSSKLHNYTAVYEQLFGGLRDSTRCLLEIGVGGSAYRGEIGGSLRMWSDYFPNARIVGIDIDPVCQQAAGERIQVMLGAQDDTAFLRRTLEQVGEPPDIIIDDASHVNKLTIASFELLFPALRPGGWYIIEDTHVSYKKRWAGNRRRAFDRFLKGLVHAMELNGRAWAPEGVQDFNKIAQEKKNKLDYHQRWVGEIHLFQGLYGIKKRT